MLGAIMPEPLAIPPRRTVLPASLKVLLAALGTRSVVMMPRAASASAWGPRARPVTSWATPRAILSIGSCGPITPVELGTTSRGFSWIPRLAKCSATRWQVWMAWPTPSWPVASLAQPELMTMAWACPLRRWRLPAMTGAPGRRFFVKTAAAVQGRSARISVMSGLPEGLRPQVVPAARKPWGKVTQRGRGEVGMVRFLAERARWRKWGGWVSGGSWLEPGE